MVKNIVGENSLGKAAEVWEGRALWVPHKFYSSKAARMASPPNISTNMNVIVTTEDITCTFLVSKPGVQYCPWLLLQQTPSIPTFRRSLSWNPVGLLHGSGHGGDVQNSHLITEGSVWSGFIFRLVSTGNKTPPTLLGVANPTPQLLNSGSFERPLLLWGTYSSKIETPKSIREMGRDGNPSPPKIMEQPSEHLALPPSSTHVLKNPHGS